MRVVFNPASMARTALLAAALTVNPLVPDAAFAASPCGVPGGAVCAGKAANAPKAVWSELGAKPAAAKSTSAFPQCKKAWDKDKPCAEGAALFIWDGTYMKNGAGKNMYKKAAAGGVGGSGDVVYVRALVESDQPTIPMIYLLFSSCAVQRPGHQATVIW